MLKKYLILLFLLGMSSLFSQEKNCDCLAELDQVSKRIENAKSYKIQIKKTSKEEELEHWALEK